MRSYKIESYVPEETFLAGKDARFCRAAFEDCFAVDVHNHFDIIAACRKGNLIGKSLADAFSLSLSNVANLVHLFDGDSEFLALPCPKQKARKTGLCYFFSCSRQKYRCAAAARWC